MAWQLLAAALPAAAKVAGTALNKPRQEDYRPQTDYMKKYLSFIRGRSADKEVMHQAMQPALKVAGRQGRQMQQQVGYDVAKSGLGGSGIEAQMRLSAGQQTQDALATATDKAVAAQAAETSRIGQQAAGITAQIGAEEARADQAYKAAQSQYRRQLTSDVIGGVASVASAGIAQAGQLNEAKLLATKRGYFGSAEDVQGMVDQGWTAQMLQQESARIDQQVNSMLGSGIDRSDLYTELGLGSGYNADMSSVVASDVSKFDSSVEKEILTDIKAAGIVESGTPNNAIVDNVKTEIKTPEVETTKKPFDFKLPDGTVVKTGSPEHKEYLKNFKTKAEKAKNERKKSKELLKETRAKAIKKIPSETSKEEEKSVVKEIDKYARIKKSEMKLLDKSLDDYARQKTSKTKPIELEGVSVTAKRRPVKPTDLTNAQDSRVRYLQDRGLPDEMIEAQLGVVLPKTGTGDLEPIFATVKKFESGKRASRNNNVGAVVFSNNLQKQYPEMTRGDSFVDEAGKTRYTAKFPDKKTGDRINKEIMFKIFEEVGGDTSKFYARWSGLPEDSATVKNFVSSIGD
tara:strand:+ start:4244 stop:5959 length:1716 start_codon:yes stop_codon:yes gene_type:complete